MMLCTSHIRLCRWLWPPFYSTSFENKCCTHSHVHFCQTLCLQIPNDYCIVLHLNIKVPTVSRESQEDEKFPGLFGKKEHSESCGPNVKMDAGSKVIKWVSLFLFIYFKILASSIPKNCACVAGHSWFVIWDFLTVTSVQSTCLYIDFNQILPPGVIKWAC